MNTSFFHSQKCSESIVRWSGHSHVCRVQPGRPLGEHRDALREAGLNYFGFGHPWDSWDLDLIREWESDPEKIRAYRVEKIWETQEADQWLRAERFDRWRQEYSTRDFLFEIDQETPKIRFGHLWWLGWQPEKAPWHDYDAIFDPWQMYRQGSRPPFHCRMIPEVIRIQVGMGALPVYAHPTSWWTHQENHITNIASTLIPDILTDQAAGCLVVMGYDADQKHYQSLWFHLLDKGYFITGVAETDACLDGKKRFDRAVFQNITPVAEFSTQGIQEALRLGHNVMSTGLGLSVRCGEAGPGDRIESRCGEIAIRANRLDPSHTYRLSIIHNSTVVLEKDIIGQLEWEELFPHDGVGWVVVKMVNKDLRDDAAISNPLFFSTNPVRVTGRSLPDSLHRYWDAPAAQELLYYLVDGTWRRDYPGRSPGDVPWEAFRWDDWRKILNR